MRSLFLITFLLTQNLSTGAEVSSSGSTTCNVDSDCETYNSCVNKLCVHKEIFPLGGTEWGGTIILIVVAMISNAGGVGGSVICTSLMLLMFYFNPHQSVALSQSFVFAGTTTTVCLKIRDRHPTRNRPLIHYDVLMQLCSPLLLGVSIGVLVNPVFPGWLILAILTLVVLYLAIAIFLKAKSLYKTESLVKKALKEQALIENRKGYKEIVVNGEAEDHQDSKPDHSDSGREPPSPEEIVVKSIEIGSASEDEAENDHKSVTNEDKLAIRKAQSVFLEREYDTNDNHKVTNAKNSDLPEHLRKKIDEITKAEGRLIQPFHFIYFILLALFSILFTLLLGSNGANSIANIKVCQSGYYGLIAAYIIAMLLLCVYSSVFLIRKTMICESANYDFDIGDVKWNLKRCIAFVVIGIVTGFFVGLLGLGAGYIIGPILLYMKVRPEIATVSSSFTISLTAFTATVQFFITGIIDWRYALWLMVSSGIGAAVGILVVRRQFIKLGRTSLLIFGFCMILTCSFVIIPIIGVLNAIQQNNNGTFVLGFTPLC